MENPFEIVNSSGLRPPSLKEGRVSQTSPEPEPSLVKGGQGEFTPSYNTRRADLRPAVRDYADNLHTRLLEIYKKYGATDVKGMYANVSAGKRVRIAKADVEEADRLRDELNQVLDSRELPIGHHELPPLEEFEKMIARLEARGMKLVGLDEWDEYEMIDGQLNGRVMVGVGEWRPLINGETVTKIGGRDFVSCDCIRNVDGKVNGIFYYFLNSHGFPVIGEEPILKIEGQEILDCADVRNVDGKLNGRVLVGNDWLPVINGVLIKSIHGKRIEHCDDIRNVGGKLNGRVRIGGIWLPVIYGEIVSELKGQEIKGCKYVRNIDGKLNGRISLEGGYLSPVINGEAIKKIEDRQMKGCGEFNNIAGKLNGWVTIEGRFGLPVIDGKLIWELDGEKIESCKDVRNIGGKLNCKVRIKGHSYPVIEGKLITNLEGKEVLNCGQVFNVGGQLCGDVTLNDGGSIVRFWVLLGKLLRQD